MAKLVRELRDIFEPQSNQFMQLENCARKVRNSQGCTYGYITSGTVTCS